MNFQELKDYLESLGCNVDHYEDESYWVTNCINAECCIIENLSSYSEIALCHYFLELGVSAPGYLRDEFYKYKDFRENKLKILAGKNRD